MKCPKCGFNSFDYLDSCKKCGSALAAFKESIGLRPVILPAGAAIAATAAAAAGAMHVAKAASESSGDDIFQWDIPSSGPSPSPDSSTSEEFELDLGEEPRQSAAPAPDPFSFEDELTAAPAPQPPPATASLEEFSFDLPDSREEKGDSSPSQPFEQPATEEPADNAFGELSFDLPDSQESPEMGAPPPSFDQAAGEEAAESVFGEFSFDEPAPAVAETSPDSDDFPFDPFGDLEEAGLKEETIAPLQPANEPGEFDLDSFLAMDEPPAAPKENAASPPGTDAHLEPGEFDALFGFGELEERDKKP